MGNKGRRGNEMNEQTLIDVNYHFGRRFGLLDTVLKGDGPDGMMWWSLEGTKTGMQI